MDMIVVYVSPPYYIVGCMLPFMLNHTDRYLCICFVSVRSFSSHKNYSWNDILCLLKSIFHECTSSSLWPLLCLLNANTSRCSGSLIAWRYNFKHSIVWSKRNVWGVEYLPNKFKLSCIWSKWVYEALKFIDFAQVNNFSTNLVSAANSNKSCHLTSLGMPIIKMALWPEYISKDGLYIEMFPRLCMLPGSTWVIPLYCNGIWVKSKHMLEWIVSLADRFQYCLGNI